MQRAHGGEGGEYDCRVNSAKGSLYDFAPFTADLPNSLEEVFSIQLVQCQETRALSYPVRPRNSSLLGCDPSSRAAHLAQTMVVMFQQRDGP